MKKNILPASLVMLLFCCDSNYVCWGHPHQDKQISARPSLTPHSSSFADSGFTAFEPRPNYFSVQLERASQAPTRKEQLKILREAEGNTPSRSSSGISTPTKSED